MPVWLVLKHVLINYSVYQYLVTVVLCLKLVLIVEVQIQVCAVL